MVVYDVTCRESFQEVKNWIKSVRSNSTNRSLTIALVGNKIDLATDQVVTTEEGETLARESGLLFFETSAMLGTEVKTAFIRTAGAVLRKLNQGLIDVEDPSHGVRLSKAKGKVKSHENLAQVNVTQIDHEEDRSCYCFN